MCPQHQVIRSRRRARRPGNVTEIAHSVFRARDERQLLGVAASWPSLSPLPHLSLCPLCRLHVSDAVQHSHADPDSLPPTQTASPQHEISGTIRGRPSAPTSLVTPLIVLVLGLCCGRVDSFLDLRLVGTFHHPAARRALLVDGASIDGNRDNRRRAAAGDVPLEQDDGDGDEDAANEAEDDADDEAGRGASVGRGIAALTVGIVGGGAGGIGTCEDWRGHRDNGRASAWPRAETSVPARVDWTAGAAAAAMITVVTSTVDWRRRSERARRRPPQVTVIM